MRRVRALATIIAGIAAILVAYWMLRPAEKLLDKTGTRLALSREQKSGRTVARDVVLSDHELVEVESQDSFTHVSHVGRYDCRTGVTTPIPDLEKSALQHPNGWAPMLSPDQKWLLCFEIIKGKQGNIQWAWQSAVCREDGRVVRWPRIFSFDGSCGGNWSADSKSFMLVYEDRIVSYFVDPPGAIRTVKLPHLLKRYYLIATLSDGLLLRHYGPPNSPPDLKRVFFRGATPEIVDVPVKLPNSASDRGAQLNAASDRLAWVLEMVDKPPTTAWGRLFARATGSKPHKQYGIWVSRIDGTDFREIGHVHDDDLRLNGWLPGDKAICYVRKNYLCKVDLPD